MAQRRTGREPMSQSRAGDAIERVRERTGLDVPHVNRGEIHDYMRGSNTGYDDRVSRERYVRELIREITEDSHRRVRDFLEWYENGHRRHQGGR